MTSANSTADSVLVNTRLAKICETIREEALLPARTEAQKIEEQARNEAETIRQKAKNEANQLLETAKKEIAKHKQVVESSLEQASRQVVEHLKERIEHTLFQENLAEWVKKQMDSPESVASLTDVMVQAIAKEGTAADFAIDLPKKLSGNAIIAQLGDKFLKELGKNPIRFGNEDGGVVVKLQAGRVQIDVTAEVVTELLSSYLRKDFRRYVFGSNGS